MTATGELRRMLDERGVEWGANDTYRLLVTSWNDASGHSWVFMEHRDGSFSKLTAYHLTPEQVIAATLESDGEYELKMDSLLCQLTGGLFSKTKTYSLDFMESCVEEAFEARSACPTSTTHAIIVSDESTDCATGYCRCELCGKPIDFWDHYCKHCGAEVER